MTNQELAKAVRNNMFATRDTYDQAMEYAYSIARGTDNPAAVMCAVQVVVNTLAKYIAEIKETV